MDKIERLISIIMILLKKDIVSTREFAQLFHVSKRTILRDMEALSLANIPIYAVTGVHGGYGILEEYKVDKRLLSSSDLENILIALSGLEKIMLSDEVELTLRKIEAMVSPWSRNSSIQLSFYPWEGRFELHETLKVCQEAIAKHKLVSIAYIDRNGTTTKRTVEPYQLHFSESSWYLKGFCLERQGNRTFKLSRIGHLAVEETTFIPRDYGAEQQDGNYPPQVVALKVLISLGIADQFIERYGRKSIASHSPDDYLATIYLPQNNIGFQFLAGFGTQLKIVEPQVYVDQFHVYLQQMVEMYSSEVDPYHK